MKKSASQRAKALRLRWEPRKHIGLTSRKNTRPFEGLAGASPLPAKCLRECLADGGGGELEIAEVEGEETVDGDARSRMGRYLRGAAAAAAATGAIADAGTVPTAGSGNGMVLDSVGRGCGGCGCG